MKRPLTLMAGAIGATLLLSGGVSGFGLRTAAAQTSDAARSQALFDQALALASQSKFKEACPLFRASFDIEPRTGTALNLAVCYEKTYRLASAWASYRDALALAQREGNTEREERARQKIAQLEPQLVRLSIRVGATRERAKLQVTRDGNVVPEAEWGVPVPVDQGPHTVRVEAAGFWPWEQQVQVSTAAETTVLTVPALRPKSWWTPSRVAGVSLAGAGAAALATGLVFGLVANGTYSDAQGLCPAGGTTDCAPGAIDGESRARSQAMVSTALTIGGLALAAGGAALIVLGKPRPPREAAQPAAPAREVSLRLLPGALQLSGRFD